MKLSGLITELENNRNELLAESMGCTCGINSTFLV